MNIEKYFLDKIIRFRIISKYSAPHVSHCLGKPLKQTRTRFAVPVFHSINQGLVVDLFRLILSRSSLERISPFLLFKRQSGKAYYS